MKKIISLLSLTLALSILACTLAGCAQKSNMLDMAQAVWDGKVDEKLVNIEKIDGFTFPNGEYDKGGEHNYSEHSVELESGMGHFQEYRHSATLRQTTRNVEIKAGSQEDDYRDYVKLEDYSSLTWAFDSTTETGDFIKGTIEVRTRGLEEAPNGSFLSISYVLYDIEPFTDNVNSTEPYFEITDLKNIEISEYKTSEYGNAEPAEWEEVNVEHLSILAEMINRDLVQMVKTCEAAGYPVVIPEK